MHKLVSVMHHKHPLSDTLQVSIYLPPLRQLKGIVDRMKALDNYVVSGQSWVNAHCEICCQYRL